MKKKMTSLLLATLLGASFIAGCGGGDKKADVAAAPQQKQTANDPQKPVKMTNVAEAGEPVDYQTAYDPVLKNIANHLMLGTSPADAPDELMGVMEYNHTMGFAKAYDTLGYALKDISGDNVPELLIGDIPEGGRQILFAVYSLNGKTPKVLASGHYRNAYHLLRSGELFMTASASAASSIYATYKPDFHASKLDATEYRFSALDDSNQIKYYQNAYGKYDKATSQQIAPDDFEMMEEKLYKQITTVPLTSFTKYSAAQEQAAPYQPPTITHAQAVIGDVSDFTRFDATSSQYGVEVAIVSQQTLKNFRLLKLTYRDKGDGKVHFDTQTLFTARELMYPFVTRVDFPGSIPQYGISFVDKNGQTHYYTIDQSGEDGSLQLNEFNN